MIKINLKDKKILYQLSLNARQSYSQIGKKIGVSSQLTEYKIKRLEKLGIIKRYYTCIDISKIGYSIFKIYIKLQNLDEKKEKEMINDLKNNPSITWVATCDGVWDLYIVIWSKNVFQFNEIFKEINNKFSFYFSRKTILADTKVLQFMRKYLAPTKEEIDYSKIEWAGEISEVKLDSIDFRILLIISLNARLSDVDIAKKIDTSRKVVAYRIKNMIEKKIIFGFKPFLNGDLLNFKTYKIFITIQSLTLKKEKELINFLNKHQYVMEAMYCMGNWELELEIETPNIDENHNLIRDLRYNFNDVIKEIEILAIYKSYKYDYLPEGLKEIKEKIKEN